MKQTPRDLSLICLFAALLAVFGLIPKIDLPLGVPITLQTLGVMLAGCLLGPKRGFQAVLLFLIAVAAGLPLLSGGRGGLGVFVAPSSGYLIGFPIGAAVAGLIMSYLPTGTPKRAAASAFAASAVGGMICIHMFGVIGLIYVAKLTFSQAVMATLVFVPGDLLKCALCAALVHSVAKGLPDWSFGGQSVREP